MVMLAPVSGHISEKKKERNFTVGAEKDPRLYLASSETSN